MGTSRHMSTDKQQRKSKGPVLTDKALSRVRHNGQLVLDEVTADVPPMLCSAVWHEFKQMPTAQYACVLLSALEPDESAGLYRRSARRPAGVALFEDIASIPERDKAKEIYAELCERHSERLASCRWLRPVLAGRLAGWPPTPMPTGPPGAARCVAKRQGSTLSSATGNRAGILCRQCRRLAVCSRRV
jgi:hypothetical protein